MNAFDQRFDDAAANIAATLDHAAWRDDGGAYKAQLVVSQIDQNWKPFLLRDVRRNHFYRAGLGRARFQRGETCQVAAHRQRRHIPLAV